MRITGSRNITETSLKRGENVGQEDPACSMHSAAYVIHLPEDHPRLQVTQSPVSRHKAGELEAR
jgi:hypothetical protein